MRRHKFIQKLDDGDASEACFYRKFQLFRHDIFVNQGSRLSARKNTAPAANACGKKRANKQEESWTAEAKTWAAFMEFWMKTKVVIRRYSQKHSSTLLIFTFVSFVERKRAIALR